MVDSNTNLITILPLRSMIISALQQLLDRQITTYQLVQFAEEQHWELLEGQYRHDSSTNANQLREVLADVVAQWESRSPESSEEFPTEWVHHWLNQLQVDSPTPKMQSPKNQPTFNIHHVGIINTGDTTIHGNQIGIQSSTSPATNSVQPKSSTASLTLFYSYSHKDETLRDELNKHLKLLQRQGIIDAWYDRDITAGTDWADAIDTHLNTADIILLLISADFLASDYCYETEMQRALERHNHKEARVIPIILRECDWTSAPFGKLQALPIAHSAGAKAVTSWNNQDEAFSAIAQGIRRAAEAIRKERLV